MIPGLAIVTFIAVYLISAVAVALWIEIVPKAINNDWIGDNEIITPIHNTLVAIRLWTRESPFSKK